MSDGRDRQDGAPPSRSRSMACARPSAAARCCGPLVRRRRGGFLVMFGPNGAGKTTTLRVLATLLTSSGSAPGGRPRRARGPDAGAPRRRVHLAQPDALPRPDRAGEPALLRRHVRARGPRGAHHGAPRAPRAQSHRRYDVVRTFSKGMRQRLAIARAILHRPRVLLLDEPHSGLDPRAVDILDGLLTEIRDEHTFVMVTHHIEKGLELATRLMIVDGGSIVWEHAAGVAHDTFNAVYREHVQEGAWHVRAGPVHGDPAQGPHPRAAHARDARQHVPLRPARHGDLPLRLRRQGGHRPHVLHRRHALGDVHLPPCCSA